MRVIGINGSPRRRSNTELLLSEVIRGAESRGASSQTFILNDLSIKPCQHCDSCLSEGNCVIQDDMRQIYQELEKSDIVVLASPLHFMTITAQMKLMMDRCQAIWARKYHLKIPPLGERRLRKGVFVSVGGRMTNNLFQPAMVTVKTLFRTMDVEYTTSLLFPGVDQRGAIIDDSEAMLQAYLTGQKLVAF